MSQLCSDSTPTCISRSLAATVSVFVLGDLRLWLVQLLVAAAPLTIWLFVLSLDDHPVLDLVAQEHGKDSKLSSSFPHRCIRLSACILSLHLSPLSSACSCASTSCRSSWHCVSWLSESSTSVLSANASSEHLLSPRSATGLHVIKTSWSAFGCCRSCDELLPF